MLWKAELPIEVRDQLTEQELDALINDLDEAVEAVCLDYGVEL